MALNTYRSKKFTAEHRQIIDHANAICAEYAEQGLVLTLRQLYYQFVARGLLANRQSEYKRLGDICNDARMAGEMDWGYLIDRTRNLVRQPFWKGPTDLIKGAADQYKPDLWKPQKKRVEVWVEKDAAIGVIETICSQNDVAYFSCRGYTSVSELHVAAERVFRYLESGEQVTILHIGDHDPSGIDMSRDIEDRLRTFIHNDWARTWAMEHGLYGQVTRGQIKGSMRRVMGENGSHIGSWEDPWQVKRIALNIDQVERYSPPPNPAKQTDARFERYMAETGLDESWELDALDPTVLQDLIQAEIDEIRDEEIWAEENDRMDRHREVLRAVANNWAEIARQYGPAHALDDEETTPEEEGDPR